MWVTRVVYDLLFQPSAATLLEVARTPKHLGAALGFLSVLHRGGQTLLHQPHVHCVVPAGGLSPDGTRWVYARPSFFLHVKVLSWAACYRIRVTWHNWGGHCHYFFTSRFGTTRLSKVVTLSTQSIV